ncbi:MULTISPECIES: hypothetical protein [Paracoccus]|uniref:hypothetical protein n=1 Tax=Paracoccus TaxID=265 RepID=UPI00254F484E|nr:hypothetical protein [Paracoccus sp. SSJ]MDK8874715.1 hypothetical protein [Paracoccus sp. SSJ]
MASQSRFLSDVRDHQMTIELDQGVHRSILFKRPRSSAYYFRLVTWPGRLTISGDMGDYTFARLIDMFEFFRHAGPAYDRGDRINVDYWDEKLTAICKGGERYDLDEGGYIDAVRSMLGSHIRDMPLRDAITVVREAKWDDLFTAPSTTREAEHRLYAWRCPVTGNAPFSNLWDRRITTASFHLVWCMRAIQWGIKRYDLHRQGRTQADHDRRVLAGAI